MVHEPRQSSENQRIECAYFKKNSGHRVRQHHGAGKTAGHAENRKAQP
jgi:hypothetical protein